jgi:hypothetical protein
VGEPLKTVRRAAKKAKVRAVPSAVLNSKATPLAREILAMPDEAGKVCLEEAVATVETGDAPVRRAAQGWAAGDVATALTSPRTGDRCLAAVPGAGALRRDAIAARRTRWRRRWAGRGTAWRCCPCARCWRTRACSRDCGPRLQGRNAGIGRYRLRFRPR